MKTVEGNSTLLTCFFLLSQTHIHLHHFLSPVCYVDVGFLSAGESSVSPVTILCDWTINGGPSLLFLLSSSFTRRRLGCRVWHYLLDSLEKTQFKSPNKGIVSFHQLYVSQVSVQWRCCTHDYEYTNPLYQYRVVFTRHQTGENSQTGRHWTSPIKKNLLFVFRCEAFYYSVY